MESQLFAPFRAVGFVSSHIPFDITVKGSEHFVTTAIGSSFHQYNCSKLNLSFVGESLKSAINFVLSTRKNTAVASDNLIYLYNRGKIINIYKEHSKEVEYMINIGELIISLDADNNVNVWSEDTLETFTTISLPADSFSVTTLVHPSTYLNKILLASKQGSLQIWNIKTNKLIYEIAGWKNAITVMNQAPAIDVIGIGLQNGYVHLHNIKVDKTLMTFYQEYGPVTALTFRTDGTPIMACGSTEGHITYWDLEKRKLLSTQTLAHQGSVTSMAYLQKQPLMITSGPDNSLKVWIFDNPDGSGRLLRSRCGHSGPPTQTLFYGTFGNVILTSGMDNTLRHTSIMRGVQCHEFSQGSVIKRANKKGVEVDTLKLPPITCFAAETSRQYDWDNIITCHLGLPFACTWSSMKRSIGKYKLSHAKDKTVATAVDISSCGNFCVVGYKNGDVDKYNMQSGIRRATFGKTGKMGHKGSVRGVAVDLANFMMISSSADKTIKFWNFKNEQLIDTINCNCPVTKSKLHRESSLLAVSFDDYSIELYDIDTKRMVRQFNGHSNVITDISWSYDGRWLVSSSMDGTIKTWDVPSARLIDCFLIDEPATSVAFSPSGEFLATTHQDNLGIYLWSNKTIYTGVHPTPLANDYDPATIELPSTQIEIDDDDDDNEMKNDNKDGGEENIENYKSPAQLADLLVTLSTVPESRWRSLTCLDLIKQRNKPKQPPKKPKAAPFFLPTIAGLETKFQVGATDENQDKISDQSKFINKFDSATQFQKLLTDKWQDNVDLISKKLNEFTPSEADIELRTLSPEGGGEIQLMANFMKSLSTLLLRGKDYELMQAYVTLFIKMHGDAIRSDDKLRKEGESLLETIQCTWSRSNELINQSMCLVKYFKSATI